MKTLQDILFITQARLSSTRIPQKMILPFGGSTLSGIILNKIKKSNIPLNQFYFSVYEPELKYIGEKHGVQIYERSQTSANSEGADPREIYEWYKSFQDRYKYVILISGCCPFLKVETINRFIQKYCEISYSGLFGVIKKQTYYWNKKGQCITDFGNSEIMNTKFVKPVYEASHAIYASSIDLIAEGKWMGDFSPFSPCLFVMDEIECLDIDYRWQFDAWDILYRGLYA